MFLFGERDGSEGTGLLPYRCQGRQRGSGLWSSRIPIYMSEDFIIKLKSIFMDGKVWLIQAEPALGLASRAIRVKGCDGMHFSAPSVRGFSSPRDWWKLGTGIRRG